MANEILNTSRTPEQQKKKDSQDAYMKKLKDIKIRVPLDYYDKIDNHLKQIQKREQLKEKPSINKWILSLIQKDIGERIVTIREKNRLQKEEKKTE